MLVWVALLLAKVHRTEVKKEIYRTLDSHSAPVEVIFFLIKISARKLPQNNDITTIPQSTLHATSIHPQDNKNFGRNDEKPKHLM